MYKGLLLFCSGIFVVLFIACSAPADSSSVPVRLYHYYNKDSVPLSTYGRHFNDAARFFAGLEQINGSKLKDLEKTEAWQKHQKRFSHFYDSVKTVRIDVMRNFARSELAQVNREIKTLYYPFSGPDFIHADIFFPSAQNIVMLGLERAGNVPRVENMNDKEIGTFFQAVKLALDSIFIWGYFMTNDMNKDFARSLDLRGVTPIYLMFMARSGYYVLNVERVTINKSGDVVPSPAGSHDDDSPWDNSISGIRIEYIKPNDYNISTLFYFSLDASEDHLQQIPEFAKFLNKLDVNVTFMKAASYLSASFHTVRDVAVNKSKYIFQSDAGIPVRFMPQSEWDYQLYGVYRRTIGVFRWAFQPELKKMYETSPNIKPLPFGICYGYRYNESNLMLITKKTNN